MTALVEAVAAPATETPTHAPRVKHIRLPHDPDTAWCGAKRRQARRFYWREVEEADICVVCLSFPGAREYATRLS